MSYTAAVITRYDKIYSIMALTAISLYSLSCLQWAGGEERGHGEEGGLWRGRPAQTHH